MRAKGMRYTFRRIMEYFALKSRFDYAILHKYRANIIKEIQGSQMCLNLGDTGVHRNLFLRGYHEKESTEIFKGELSKGMRVLDIGANIGYYPLIEAKIVGHEGKVYAIEPDPENFAALVFNIRLNGYEGYVEPYQLAMGNKQGKILLERDPWHCNWHRITREETQYCIEVRATTVDAFCKDKEIDLVRMDVEGFEYYIVKGMRRTLETNRPLKIFIEIHPAAIENYYGENTQEVLQTLARHAFRLRYMAGTNQKAGRWWETVSPKIGKRVDIPLGELLEDSKLRSVLLKSGAYRVFLVR